MLGTTGSQCSTLVSLDDGGILPELLARHEGLVQWVVRRQCLGDLSFADALHEGRIGLWRALVSYNPSRGTAFSTYAVPAIARAVWSAVARGRVFANDRCSAQVVPEPIDPVESVYRAEVHARLGALVEQLPDRLRLVIVAHYGLGDREPQSFAAIGRTLHVTRQRVQQLHTDALLWLAHPAHSLSLRRLLGYNTRADYQRSLTYHYRIARARRRDEASTFGESGRAPLSPARGACPAGRRAGR